MDALSERNPRVVSAVKLQRAAQRRKTGQFLAEGANAVTAALETGRVRELFYSVTGAARETALIAGAAADGVRTTLVSDRAAEHLGETVTAPGLVAVCDLVDVALSDILDRGPRMLAVPVEIAEPGNAGTLIRVADAVGADGVVLAGDTVDPHNGKCVRASAGSLFHVPIARSRDVTATLDAISAAGATILATAATGEVDLDAADEILAGPVAWLFGNEAHGLDPAVAARADHRIRIPIHGRAESLNLAAAAAICLYAGSRVQHRG
ncbi:RNA methyltransferase [Nocardia asteroides NBRC 15531]|uniref:TrmH family RNA methyltransferase n=1 Tax=Nocardia asteroides TaxID=1824 RepID=UPI000307A265|nr:RNA methyltransferase [Nocardia asteroides]TLF62832.1 RNA methyltransferase [Nocardia asteroides NBRC 15531]UGT46493.1 RNA methyltransferase [Nocardia asteroides]SFN55081.1 RNA methyltransferase, TrmH family [Nocardia asteroides]VEG34682.1 Putative TrmH family tRNA/rRNA methyltransferase [Nocardia asteroides]